MLALALEFLDKLLESLFLDEIKRKITDYLDRRNVERTISRCSEAPAQALESYFHNEGIDKEKVKIILEELQQAITSAKVDAKMLASASLNSEKLVETILSKYPIPEKIQEKQLEWPFQMALQISADALCNIGPRFNEWDREAWRRNFEAFDKLLQNQEAILQAVGPGGEGSLDKRFEHTYRSHILRRLAQIDASTLRVSSSFFLDLTTVFVQPEVIRVPKSKKKSKSIEKVTDRIVSLEEARQQLLSRPESDGKPRRIYAEKFVAKHRRCAIVGLPGTGKTTLLQHILVSSSKGEISFNGTNAVIPVLVRARDLDIEHLPGPDDLLQVTEGKVLAGACPSGFLSRQFKAGRVLLLIDGLDEVVVDKRDNLIRWISDFIELFPRCRYIISSRPAGYQSHAFQKLRFNEVTLCEFNSDQIREYVRRWTKAVEIAEGVPSEEAEEASSKSAQALVKRAERNPYVQRIATNPLMLSTLCLVQRYEGGDLPNRRVVLYQRCVEGLLFYWDNKRGLPPAMLGSLQLEHKMLLLRRLALEMQIQGVAEIKEEQIKKSFSNSLIELGQRPNTEAILDNIRDRSGLLIERRPRIYGFSHLTFQEYMGALSINQGDYNEYDRLFLFSKRSDPQWSEVIALYAGTGPRGAVESLLKELVKTGNTESILLAGECLASAQNVGLSTQKDVISRLLYLEDESLSRPIKHLAVNSILLSLDDHIVIEEAVRALHKTVRIHAIRFFYFKRSPKSIDALFQLGKSVILGTQPTEKYDYGVSLILLLIEHSDAAKALANLANLASKQTGLDERRNILWGLFSMELWRADLPGMELMDRLPGVFAFLDKPNATKEQINICKFIEVASSLGIDRNFIKEHVDLWRRFTPSNIILEKLKHLAKRGHPSVREQATRAARRYSSIIAELDKKLAKPRKK